MTIGPLQILIFLVIVAVLFGGKRLRNLGEDLGTSIKGFKKAIHDDKTQTVEKQNIDEKVITTVEKEDADV